jgi:hypothetical protein
MNHSIPYFRHVKEVTWYETEDGFDHYSMVVIAPDPQAGKRNRYSVLVIGCQTGTVRCIGRELPIGHARKIAKQAAPPWAK